MIIESLIFSISLGCGYDINDLVNNSPPYSCKVQQQRVKCIRKWEYYLNKRGFPNEAPGVYTKLAEWRNQCLKNIVW